MYAGFQIKKQVYEGSIAPANLLQTVVTCYNGTNTSQSACSGIARTAFSQPPVTQVDEYTYPGTSTSPSLVETIYDCKTQTPCYGNVVSVAHYDFGAAFPPSIPPVSTTTTTYDIPSGGVYPCGTLSNSYIFDRPCSVTTTASNGAMINQTKYTYNPTGHVLTTSRWVSGSGANATYVTTSATYNTTGTVGTTTDSTGSSATYGYDGSCAGLEPTGVSISGVKIALTQSMSWDCNAVAPTSRTDENTNITHTNFLIGSTADPFYRPLSDVDAMNPANTTTYGYTARTFESAMNFNGTTSTTDALSTSDSLGRLTVSQTRQAPGASMFDSTQLGYGWTKTTSLIQGGTLTTKSIPYSGTASQGAPPNTPVTTTQYDALNRPISITDATSGVTTHTYKFNDDLIAVGPPPTGENLKQRQLEYDGLGRLTSVCEILATGGSPCGQSSAASGYKTSYAYSTPAAGGSQMVVTQGVQTRTYVYDGMGRLISENNPESGTTTYTYDSANTPACGAVSQPGSLLAVTDNANNYYCYQNDKLGRPLAVGNSNNSTTPCKRFSYDTPSGFVGQAPPSGYVGNNIKHRLVEAETDDCTWPTSPAHMLTDEWFAYDANGRLTDVWEYTSKSKVYYHTSASYFANDAPNQLTGLPGYSTLTYNVDGEGRWNTAMLGSVPVVSGVTYDVASKPKVISIGSGTDEDQYSYDPSERMTQYQFFVGTKSNKGVPAWNPNGSVGSLAITDGFNTSNNQTCTFSYDDLARLTSDNCGSVWSQTYSYDQYGNLSKAGSAAFACPGCYNPAKNQYQTIGATYDSSGDGNLTYDGAGNHYTWDLYGKMATVNGTTVTYDALGRPVTNGSVEILYTPIGKVGVLVNATNFNNAYVPLPGGGAMSLGCCSSDNIWYLHRDWIGSSRLTSDVPPSGNGGLTNDRSYSPFGDLYQPVGFNDALSFAGLNSDLFATSGTGSIIYDTPNRELANNASRWLSPDPAGLAAADPTNPQSWNRYAYALNNPLSNVDPSGLECVWDDGSYDSNDDPVTGLQPGGTHSGCEGNGGTWLDNVNGPDWSPDPNSTLAQAVQDIATGNFYSVSVTAANNSPSNAGCFLKGVGHGAVGALIVAGGTVLASTVLAPEVVSAGLLAAGAYGSYRLYQNVKSNWQSGNQAGLAYNAGSLLGGAAVGGATSYGVRYAITGETNGPSSLLDFSGLTKITNPFRSGNSIFGNIRASFAKGPDLLGGGAAIAGGAGYGQSGCQ